MATNIRQNADGNLVDGNGNLVAIRFVNANDGAVFMLGNRPGNADNDDFGFYAYKDGVWVKAATMTDTGGFQLRNPDFAGPATSDDLRVDGELYMGYEKAQIKDANYTMTEGDVGQVTRVTVDGVVITLPATAEGMTFKIMNGGANGAVGFSISPQAGDKIMGCGITSADDKDIINTKATAKKGDHVVLIADGNLGWYIQSMVGTWARE